MDIRGRSQTLKVNYRTSHQIRSHADLLLANAITDVDGNTESRKGTISAFEGVAPKIQVFKDAVTESNTVGEWLKNLVASGVQPHEVAVFVRSDKQIQRAIDSISSVGFRSALLDEHVAVLPDHVSVAPMHLAKGLEFKCVAVIACDDDVIPLQERIETAADESELDEVYQSERHLLYVACTRARDHLLVTGVAPESEFLDDLGVVT